MDRRLGILDISVFIIGILATFTISVVLFPSHFKLLANFFTEGILAISTAVFFYLLAHCLRFLRLLVLTVEHRPNLFPMMGLYSTTTLISLCFPFKTGELFKVYEFSRFFRSFGTGISIIAVERFFDALSLIFLITLARFYYGNDELQLSVLLPALSIFVIFIILTYLFLPRSFSYLRSLTLNTSESRRGLYVLDFIRRVEQIYDLFCSIIRGRFLVLAILSICVWLCELVTIYQFVMEPASTYRSIIYSLVIAFENIFITNGSTSASSSEYLSLVFTTLSLTLIVPSILYAFFRVKKFLKAKYSGQVHNDYRLTPIKKYNTRPHI
jgi:hypothetical protein